MRPFGPLLILTTTGCVVGPPIVPTVVAPQTDSDPRGLLLAAHNRERAAVGVAPLSWDPALAAAAATHARQLASIGTLRHSSRQARPSQGENLWMGSRGAFPVSRMVASWVSEKANFRPGVFPAVSRTGNWAHVGHYSQMIWPTTTRLGCAIAGGARFEVLVCRYTPAGNIDGRPVP